MEWGKSNVTTCPLISCIWRPKKVQNSNFNFFYFFFEHNRCSISVQPNDNVCQLRIDLLDFSLAPPTGDGTCGTDVISISGSASNVPLLCGENAGQHLIADFSGTNPISIVIKSTASYTFGRHWNIRLSQIACDSGDRGKSVTRVFKSQAYELPNNK